MPELPEVEFARRRLEAAAAGRRIRRVELFHPAARRHLPPRDQRALEGVRITGVERRAKIQLVHLEDGTRLEVHFRMTGDWAFTGSPEAAPLHERIRFTLDNGTRVHLVDSRAFAVVRRHAPGTFVWPPLGPEPLTDDFTVEGFHGVLAERRAPIKPVLLDQRVVAGVGNIYASEALWEARIHPETPAAQLTRARVQRLRDAIRVVLTSAPEGRYYTTAPDGGAPEEHWRVYGRSGETCRRCASRIRDCTQSGRRSFFCPRCQRR